MNGSIIEYLGYFIYVLDASIRVLQTGFSKERIPFLAAVSIELFGVLNLLPPPNTPVPPEGNNLDVKDLDWMLAHPMSTRQLGQFL